MSEPRELLTEENGDDRAVETFVIVGGEIIPVTITDRMIFQEFTSLEAVSYSDHDDRALEVRKCWLAYGGRPIRYVVNLHLWGGSHLDPIAESYFFVENVFDLAGLVDTLKVLL